MTSLHEVLSKIEEEIIYPSSIYEVKKTQIPNIIIPNILRKIKP